MQFIVKMSFLYDCMVSEYHSAMYSSAVCIRAAFAITIRFSKDKLCHLFLRHLATDVMQCFPVLFL